MDYASVIRTIWGFCWTVIDYMSLLWAFLATEISILGVKFSIIGAFSGSIITILIVAYLVKTFVPLT